MKKLLLCAALLAANSAMAQTSVPFTGTVSTACSLTVNQPGILAVSPSQPTTMNTTGAGQSALVGVSYTGGPTLTVSMPTAFDTSPTLSFTPTFGGGVTSSTQGSLIITNNEASVTYSSGSTDVIDIGVQVSTGSSAPFPVGTYTASATVTCL